MNKEILLIIFVIVALFGFVTVYLVTNSNMVPHPLDNSSPTSYGIDSGGNRTPEQFFRDGGRSYVFVETDSETTNATIGSTVQVPLTLTHETSANPLPIVTVHYVGIQNGIRINGYGNVDVNYIVKPSTNQISLLAGESKKVVLSISIPQDLPKSVVNDTISFSVLFLDSDNHNTKDFVTNPVLVQIHIVG